jgi:acetoin utilization protein AcuB
MSQAIQVEDMISVQSIMTKDPRTVPSTIEISKIALLLENAEYHHMPVVDDGRLAGILSDRDIAQYISRQFAEPEPDKAPSLISVSEIMTTDITTVDKGTSIDCASILLLENNISCLPVVDDEHHLEGIITWKDILRFHVYHDA